MWDKGERIGKMLVNMGLVDESQAKAALKLSKENGKSLGQNMFELGYISDSSTLQLLVAQGAASPWFLGTELPEARVIRLLSPSVMREHMFVPIVRMGDLLLLAMTDTSDHSALDRVRAMTGLRIESVEAEEERIKGLIEILINEERAKQPKAKRVDAPAAAPPVAQKGKRAPVEITDVEEVPEDLEAIQFESSELSEKKAVSGPVPVAAEAPAAVAAPPRLTVDHEVVCADDTAPVGGLVDQVIADSVRRNATEILIESTNEGMAVRYRVDGRLRSIGDIPQSLAPLVEARLRLMGSLDIVCGGVPQTGTVRYQMSSRAVEFDACYTPTVYGTRILLRSRAAEAKALKLDDLGLAKTELGLVRDAMEKNEGLLLVASPTAAERNTTLYSLIADLASPARDILTCEESTGKPIAGVSHSKFVHRHDRSRSEHLTLLLRQSADIVLVDQLSDEKVASTAVRAALSGRLIVAGIEAKSALAALARLSDLGIDPYLVAASLSGVLAQRQVRTLCKSCRKKDGDTYRAAGCGECEGTGYNGTVDVHEFVPMTDEIRKLIAEKAPLHKIEERAIAAGFRPMDQHAKSLLEKGETDEREIENTFRRPVADAAGPRPLKIVVSEAAKAEEKAVMALRKEPNVVAAEYEEAVRKEREEMESLFHKESYELETPGLDTAA